MVGFVASPAAVRPGSSAWRRLAGLAAVGALVGATVGALVGCAGGSPAIRYHGLNVAPPVAASTYVGVPVAVRTVQMPPGGDRVEMTRELGQGEFVVREFDQWAAPLGRLVRQALAEDLASRLGPQAVVVPGGDAPASRIELGVDILSYRATNGTAVLTLNWGLRRIAAVATPGSAGSTLGDGRHAVRLEAPLAGDDPGSTAAAWSALLGQLADQIARTVSDPRVGAAP